MIWWDLGSWFAEESIHLYQRTILTPLRILCSYVCRRVPERVQTFTAFWAYQSSRSVSRITCRLMCSKKSSLTLSCITRTCLKSSRKWEQSWKMAKMDRMQQQHRKRQTLRHKLTCSIHLKVSWPTVVVKHNTRKSWEIFILEFLLMRVLNWRPKRWSPTVLIWICRMPIWLTRAVRACR